MPVLYRRGLLESTRVTMIAPEYISPNPDQPRRYFDPDGLSELADSIRAHGILQPLSVRRKGGGRYELIAGERRLRAAKLAGLREVPCLVAQVDEQDAGMLALIENLQRQDLDFIEEAMGISRLLEDWNMSQEQAARLLGKSQSAVANKLRLLKHSEPVLLALREAGLTERHARALLKLPTEESKLAAVKEIVRQGMSVARTEKYVETLLSARADRPSRANVGAFLNNLTQSLQKIQLSGIPAVSERRETDSQIVLTITIPK